MKQTTAKARMIFWGAIAVCVSAALVLCGVFTMRDTRNKPWKYRQTIEKPEFVTLRQEDITQPVTDLELEWINGTVTIKKSGNDAVRVIQKGAADFLDEERVQLEMDGTKLVVTDKNGCHRNFKLPRHKGTTTEYTDLELYLPEQEFHSLTFRGTAPDVEARDLWAKSLHLKTTSGSYDFENGRFSSIIIDSTSADVELSTSLPATLEMDVTSGEYDISGRLTAIHVKNTSGEVDVKTTEQAALVWKDTSGSLEAKGSFTSIQADTTTGDVEIESAILPRTIDARMLSGSMTFSLPDSPSGFMAKVESDSSGHFDTAFSVTRKGDTYYYANSQNQFRFDAGNGSVRLERNIMAPTALADTTEKGENI